VMLSSWTLPELVMPSYFYEVSEAGDTSKPGKRSSFHNRYYNQEDLDHAMISIDKAMIDLDKNMKVDFAKMEKELKAAIEKVQHIDIE
uniref:hypothetical protein n=1 Tax=Citrobacter freundii TaxID=546 RepID=UPI0013D883A8